MSSIDKTSLLREIRVVLDQNMSSTALSALGDVDTLSLDELIESKIEDAAEAVVLTAPLHLLSDVSVALVNDPDHGRLLSLRNTFPHWGTFPLPSDFARLLSFKLVSWPYALHEALSVSSPLYVQCHSPFGVCGTKDRPHVFLVPSADASGVVALEIYSGGSENDTLESGLYVSKPIISDGSITLGKYLKRPTVYYAAYLVALSIQEKEAAERLLGVCNELLRGSQP